MSRAVALLLWIGLCAPSAARADDTVATSHGVCDGGSTWRMRVAEIEDGDADDHDDAVKVTFVVDSGYAGESWDITLGRSARFILSGVRVTRDDGKVSVRRVVGEDADATFAANAVNLDTGEECWGRLVWRD